MRLNRSGVGERGISPVIGVILMIAITVVLGTVVAGFALGLAPESKRDMPEAQFDAEFDGDEVTITHKAGQEIEDGGNLEAVATDATLQGSGWADGSEVTAAESVTFTAKNGWSGGQVELHWDGEERTVVLAEWDAPG